MRLVRFLGLPIAPLVISAAHASCPDMNQFDIPTNDGEWQQLEVDLAPHMQACLRNSSYFALYGATKLKLGVLSEALELLERALLLDPENGSALIDYSEALFLSGQPLAALELNAQLQRRADLPTHLKPLLERRAERWQTFTTSQTHRIGAQLGYDTNLNGASSIEFLNLTFQDQLVTLPLDASSKPVRGATTRLHLSTTRERQRNEWHDQWYIAANTRFSKDQDSDLIQLNSRYHREIPVADGSWGIKGDLDYVNYGGNALYSAAGLGGAYTFTDLSCKPRIITSGEYQRFPQQQQMNGLELNIGIAARCLVDNHAFSGELTNIYNDAEHSTRPGQDRRGWELRTQWITSLYDSFISTELRYTHIDDDAGYNPLLNNGAARAIQRQSIGMQYIQPLKQNLTFTISLFHQQQRSNIELFQSSDTSIDFGLTYSF